MPKKKEIVKFTVGWPRYIVKKIDQYASSREKETGSSLSRVKAALELIIKGLGK